MDSLFAWGEGGDPNPCSDVISLASAGENLCDATAICVGEIFPLISEGAAVATVVSDDICSWCEWVHGLRYGDLCLWGSLAEFVSGWWGLGGAGSNGVPPTESECGGSETMWAVHIEGMTDV